MDNMPERDVSTAPSGAESSTFDPRVSLRFTRGYIPWPHLGPKTNGWSVNTKRAQLRISRIRLQEKCWSQAAASFSSVLAHFPKITVPFGASAGNIEGVEELIPARG
ncbi:MAG TPA: hypothetical protein VGP68_20420 [Gemmataceae bacterium]|jgi:hypothetical protein|nr:hypothetical protein [Gemmataceae bacterium]